MYKVEVNREFRSQNGEKTYSSVRRKIRGYFILICSLFVTVIILCLNNLSTYEALKKTQEQFETTVKKMNVIEENNSIMSENLKFIIQDNENLKTENEKLRTQYDEITREIQEIRNINEQLVRKNKELNEDNIALQNSLKMAAAAGIKPQNFTEFGGLSARSEVERGRYLGKFLGTAYTPSREECGNTKGITNSGEPIVPGISIAVDNKYWPFGTVFYIKGLGYTVAMDTGSAIKGKYRFDFSVFDKNFARVLGAREWDVYLIKLGNGKVDQIEL